MCPQKCHWEETEKCQHLWESGGGREALVLGVTPLSAPRAGEHLTLTMCAVSGCTQAREHYGAVDRVTPKGTGRQRPSAHTCPRLWSWKLSA